MKLRISIQFFLFLLLISCSNNLNSNDFIQKTSGHYLYNSDKVSQAWKCFTDRNSDPEYKNLPLYRRIIFSFNCFKPLLIWC